MGAASSARNNGTVIPEAGSLGLSGLYEVTDAVVSGETKGGRRIVISRNGVEDKSAGEVCPARMW